MALPNTVPLASDQYHNIHTQTHTHSHANIHTPLTVRTTEAVSLGDEGGITETGVGLTQSQTLHVVSAQVRHAAVLMHRHTWWWTLHHPLE